MRPHFTLIIPDSSPLITLAAADELDLLLKPGIPVVIPDGVHFEVSRFPQKLGSLDIVHWLQANPAVRIEATVEFKNAVILLEAGQKRVSGMGERCALEVVNLMSTRTPGNRSILLYEDSDVPGMRILKPDQVDTLTTADFLDQLERAKRIQSADHILDKAVHAGRDEATRRRSMTNALAHAFQERSRLGR